MLHNLRYVSKHQDKLLSPRAQRKLNRIIKSASIGSNLLDSCQCDINVHRAQLRTHGIQCYFAKKWNLRPGCIKFRDNREHDLFYRVPF